MMARTCAAKASFNSMRSMSCELESGERERFGNRGDGADAHLFRQTTGDGVGDEAGERLNAELARAAVFHQDGGGGSVRGLRGVAGSDGSLRVKDGLERGEGGSRSVGARAFVGGEFFFLNVRLFRRDVRSCSRDFDRNELFGEAAGGLRGESFLVARESELILINSRDAVMPGDALGGKAHGEKRGRIVGGEPGIGAGLVAAHGNEAHGFGSAGDDDAGGAGADAVIGERDGLETGGAEAIDGCAGNFDGKAGAKSGHARDVPTLLAFGLRAAEDDVVDGGFFEGGNASKRAGE